jgi:hypothetical protein
VAAKDKLKAKESETDTRLLRAQVGAYYFEYWPLDVRPRMLKEFPDREPIWGWKEDTVEIMEQQIDLAADHGMTYFAFDWYWFDNGQAINAQKIKESPLHAGLELYLRARNNHRLKFCLLVANHQGYEIKGTDAWKQAADYWMPYFKHPQCLTIDGKPAIIIFLGAGGDKAGFEYMQAAARKAGLPGVAIIGCWNNLSPREMGFTHFTQYNEVPGGENEKAEEHSFTELVQYMEKKIDEGGSPEQPYIPCVMAGWDRRPRENEDKPGKHFCWYFTERTPKAFQDHLQYAVNWLDKHPDEATAERLVIIYAWNELGEGGYLIPTKGEPQGAYLKAIQSVVLPVR